MSVTCATRTCHSYEPSTSRVSNIVCAGLCVVLHRFPQLQQPLHTHFLAVIDKPVEEEAASSLRS